MKVYLRLFSDDPERQNVQLGVSLNFLPFYWPENWWRKNGKFSYMKSAMIVNFIKVYKKMQKISLFVSILGEKHVPIFISWFISSIPELTAILTCNVIASFSVCTVISMAWRRAESRPFSSVASCSFCRVLLSFVSVWPMDESFLASWKGNRFVLSMRKLTVGHRWLITVERCHRIVLFWYILSQLYMLGQSHWMFAWRSTMWNKCKDILTKSPNKRDFYRIR